MLRQAAVPVSSVHARCRVAERHGAPASEWADPGAQLRPAAPGTSTSHRHVHLDQPGASVVCTSGQLSGL